MVYLEIHYITKKLTKSYRSFTTILIDSEFESFCDKVLNDVLNNKKNKINEPYIIGVQQQIIIDCFRYLLCTKYKNIFSLKDILFFIDNKEVIFNEKDLWKVVNNNVWFQDLYGKFVLGITLSN